MSTGGPFAAVAALLLAAGCAGAGAPRGPGRVSDAPTAYAHPERDPGCRATVQEPLAAYGLERVTVKLAADAQGRPILIQFLSPDLTPAAMLELRRAFESCLWKPDVGPDGQPRAWTTTIVRLRD